MSAFQNLRPLAFNLAVQPNDYIVLGCESGIIRLTVAPMITSIALETNVKVVLGKISTDANNNNVHCAVPPGYDNPNVPKGSAYKPT